MGFSHGYRDAHPSLLKLSRVAQCAVSHTETKRLRRRMACDGLSPYFFWNRPGNANGLRWLYFSAKEFESWRPPLGICSQKPRDCAFEHAIVVSQQRKYRELIPKKISCLMTKTGFRLDAGHVEHVDMSTALTTWVCIPLSKWAITIWYPSQV